MIFFLKLSVSGGEIFNIFEQACFLNDIICAQLNYRFDCPSCRWLSIDSTATSDQIDSADADRTPVAYVLRYRFSSSLRKHAYSTILKILPPQKLKIFR